MGGGVHGREGLLVISGGILIREFESQNTSGVDGKLHDMSEEVGSSFGGNLQKLIHQERVIYSVPYYVVHSLLFLQSSGHVSKSEF